MTGGGGVRTTSASTGVIYSAPQTPYSWIWGMGREKEKKGRGNKTKGNVKGGEEGEKGKEEKREWGKEEERKGEQGGRDGTPLFGTK